MPIEQDALTTEERQDLEQYLKWYQDNGWYGSEARRLAWVDMQRKHQRLEQFEQALHPPINERTTWTQPTSWHN